MQKIIKKNEQTLNKIKQVKKREDSIIKIKKKTTEEQNITTNLTEIKRIVRDTMNNCRPTR